MGHRIEDFGPVIRNTILLGTIFILLHLASITEALSYISRPMVTHFVQLLGIDAVNRGSVLVLGKLILPWTEDCSGINTLVMLLGITLWVNRSEKFGLPLILRLFLCLPAALVANLFRVLTFAAYRYVFYPDWESQQLHYFIGFVWLIPFLVLFVPDFRHRDRAQWLEILYMATVLALVAPVVFSPGGSVVAICTLFYLAHNRIGGSTLTRNWPAYVLWGISAFLIGWSRMESLWIPWLLVCPRFVAPRILFSWSGLIILSGTVSLLAMRTAWFIVVLAALAFQAYLLLKKKRPGPGRNPQPLGKLEIYPLVILLMAPFMLHGLIGISHEVERPPPGIMARQLSPNSYKIRVAGQPSDISMYWYGAYSEGRHHSLVACMRFRGLILENNDQEKDVFFGNNRWMREFFIHDKKLKSTYPEYLLATFSPFSSPGVHVIFEAPSDLMSPTYFARESERIMGILHRMYAEPS
ncbi:MAG: exosortase/archaeosortase family protein [Deltaproteobacteria bacterium]|nr:exosortase/archaeosortase family protein [Deltaproteobacteria bacterium]